MDRVTKNYLDTFRVEQSLEHLQDADAFELFADYCVVCDAYDDEFNVVDVHTGGGQDLGLDGIATIVNGALVSSPEEVDELLTVAGTLDVTFLVIQAKTSSGFSADQIGAFFDGVDEFFAETATLPMNESVSAARAVMQRIYENSLRFRKGKPYCRLSYVTTGQWVGDQYLQVKVDKRITNLRNTGLFSEVAFIPMGADEIQASYLRSKNSVTAEFAFSNKVLLPEIVGVTEAYLGVLPAAEFLKLISDGSGNIRKSLFTDNVRDFQDFNDVNIKIQKTLRDPEAKGRFVVLNNGVTVVTRELRTTRDKVALTDYQVVNGCQTSHVLFAEEDSITADVQVPVKIICTQDEDIISSIITANNSQTEVTVEDLFAISGFAKKLEAFLGAYGGEKRLHYERRSKQYNAVAGIKKVQIITKLQQIRAFAGMFLDEPHRASSYYTELYSQVGDRIFNENHKLEPYYTAAYAHYRLEYLFRNGSMPVYYKPARFHLLMALRHLVGGREMPALTANKVQPYCNGICETLWDVSKAIQVFKDCADIIERAAGVIGVPIDRDSVKTRGFTDAVKAETAAARARLPR
jgi:hypothetical protein